MGDQNQSMPEPRAQSKRVWSRKRILILGGNGMLGHKLWQSFQNCYDTWVTMRSSFHDYESYGLFDPLRTLGGVDVQNFDHIARAVETVHPDVVINAIGVIKQNPAAKDPIVSLTVNSLFPHRLSTLCHAVSARLIHISTDCVFSGRKGMYTEEDIPDAEDLYGRSKLLGEVTSSHCLTLRTSIIGRELKSDHGLLEWFLSHRTGRVQGYTNVFYTGLPTLILARIIADLIERHPDLSGLYHVSSDAISKYELLCLIRDSFQIPTEIEPFSDIHIDRSLDSGRFRRATGFEPLPWYEMVRAVATDPTPYEKWR